MTRPSTPYIRSRVNGIMVPIQPGQAGIMHRFAQAENQLVIAEVNAAGGVANSEQDQTLVSPSTPEPTAGAPAVEQPAAPVMEQPAAPAPKKRAPRSVPAVASNVPVI